jgi:dTMP kinase
VSRLFGARELEHYRGLLANREYRLWFSSSLGSSLGDWVGLFALQVLVISLAEPGSVMALFGLGALMIVRFLPGAVFAPIAGVVADRFDRKRLMVIADVARAGLFVGIAYSRNLIVLLVLALVVECLSMLYLSAKNAVLPVIVRRDDLTQANQLALLVTYGPLPFGAAVAAVIGWLAGVLDAVGLPRVDPTTAALLLNAATFALAGVLIAFLRLRPEDRGATADDTSSAVEGLVAGARFIWDTQVIRWLIVGVLGVFFGMGALVSLGPEFVRTVLDRAEADWYGLMTTVGFGILAGIVVGPAAAARWRLQRAFPAGLVIAALLAVATGLLPTFPLVQAGGFLLGAFAGGTAVLGYTLVMVHTSDDVRGRTFAAFFTGTRLAMFAALAVSPFAAAVIGIRPMVVLGGAVALTVGVWAAVGMTRGTDGRGPEPPASSEEARSQ